MTAIVMPEVDKSTVDALLKKFPDLKQIELPSIEQVGKTTEETIDRLLGRDKGPVWPWVAAGIGLVAVIGAAVAVLAFWRRPGWESSVEPMRGSPESADDIAVPAASTAMGADVATDSQADLGESALSWDTSDRPVGP